MAGETEEPEGRQIGDNLEFALCCRKYNIGKMPALPPAPYGWESRVRIEDDRSETMRLTPSEVEEIRACAKRHFGEHALVRLFGSRTDDSSRGGDIDLHIEAESAEQATLAHELEFSQDLKERIGEQRIDVIVRPPRYAPKAIDRIAVETGLVLS
jgi:predicted nucleotidyltransferase